MYWKPIKRLIKADQEPLIRKIRPGLKTNYVKIICGLTAVAWVVYWL